MIYLDHNSTTPMLPEVATAMAECYLSGYANPASQHQAGRRARQRLEQAREEIARVLGANISGRTPDRVIFTSGGTESNNLALRGGVAFDYTAFAISETGRSLPEVVISGIEHPSVSGRVVDLAKRNWPVRWASVDSSGVVSVENLRELINERSRLVSVMLGNNETGVLQPVAELAAICSNAGVPMHTDAAQVAGKLPINFQELGVAAMSVAAHKFHGPLGIGALVVRGDMDTAPQLVGGFQQGGLRPGTESVALAVGMEVALKAFERDQAKRTARVKTLRDHFEAALQEGYPQLFINGRDAERLPGTSNVAFVGLDRQQLFLALDMAGVCCSTGSACASGSNEPSPVLRAMGLPPEVINSSLRFSLGATTTETEIDEAARRILAVCENMASQKQHGASPANSSHLPTIPSPLAPLPGGRDFG